MESIENWERKGERKKKEKERKKERKKGTKKQTKCTYQNQKENNIERSLNTNILFIKDLQRKRYKEKIIALLKVGWFEACLRYVRATAVTSLAWTFLGAYWNIVCRRLALSDG